MWVPNQTNLPRKLGQSKRDMQTSLIRRKSFNMSKMFSNVLKKFSKFSPSPATISISPMCTSFV